MNTTTTSCVQAPRILPLFQAPSNVKTEEAISAYRLSEYTKSIVHRREQYIVGGNGPMPCVIARAKGSIMWTVDGDEIIDFVTMFSAMGTGHSHPKILKAYIDQLQESQLVGIALHNPLWPKYAETMCKRFGYDKVLGACSGSEAADSACKVARKWGTSVKKIPADDIVILAVGSCYHGLTSGVWTLQDSSKKRTEYALDGDPHQINYNPKTKEIINYGDLEAMTQVVEENHARVAAIIMEPIRTMLPSLEDEARYYTDIYRLCKKYNILCIADEVRQGLGRTGTFWSYNHCGAEVKPDMVCIGKSVTGGTCAQSFVMGTDECMSLVGMGEMVSTLAFAPPGVAAALAVMEVIDEENLLERATVIEKTCTNVILGWRHSLIHSFRATGADMQLYLNTEVGGKTFTARKLCALLMHRGLFIVPLDDVAAGKALRMSPPLTMTDQELAKSLSILKQGLDDIFLYTDEDIDGAKWVGRR